MKEQRGRAALSVYSLKLSSNPNGGRLARGNSCEEPSSWASVRARLWGGLVLRVGLLPPAGQRDPSLLQRSIPLEVVQLIHTCLLIVFRVTPPSAWLSYSITDTKRLLIFPLKPGGQNWLCPCPPALVEMDSHSSVRWFDLCPVCPSLCIK